jgi:arsenate reductase (glutaredoxin)
MSSITIYHNSKCSKSCDALAYLEARGYRPRVINYLETPPTVEEIRLLIKRLGIAPSSLIRAPDFNRLGLATTSDPEELIRLIAEHPILLQRPIVVAGDRARIANRLEVLQDFLPASEQAHG